MKTPAPIRLSLHGTWSLAALSAFVLLGNAPVFAQKQAPQRLNQGVRGEVKSQVQPAPVRMQRVSPQAVIDRRGMGGAVYSTGLEPITVRLIGKPAGAATYRSRIYVLVDGKPRYVGHNRENKTVSLGQWPVGELRILIETDGEGVSSTGSGTRNVDRLPHALARDLADGVVEVRFEDVKGLPEEKLVYGSATDQQYARENYFADVNLQFNGGVTADSAVPVLLEEVKKGGDRRKTAMEVLKQAHPRIARMLALRQPLSPASR